MPLDHTPIPDDLDLAALHDLAVEAVTSVADEFTRGHGRPGSFLKPDGSFCTPTDLAIEKLLSERLAKATGFAIFGEEGGGALCEVPTWVIDPVDGTTNFAAKNPMCATLLSLVVGGRPVIGVTAAPVVGMFLSGFDGSPLFDHGAPAEKISYADRPTIGFGSIVSPAHSGFSTARRHELLTRVAADYPRLRVTGSVGCDLALAARGTFGAAITFSPHPWDNAAGVVLGRCAGLTVTDLLGKPWRCGGPGVLAATPEIHEEIIATVFDTGQH